MQIFLKYSLITLIITLSFNVSTHAAGMYFVTIESTEDAVKSTIECTKTLAITTDSFALLPGKHNLYITPPEDTKTGTLVCEMNTVDTKADTKFEASTRSKLMELTKTESNVIITVHLDEYEDTERTNLWITVTNRATTTDTDTGRPETVNIDYNFLCVIA